MTKRKKLILAFIIINFLVLFGSFVMDFILGITSEYVPSTEGHSLNPKPLSLMFAVCSALLALVELVLGILTYKGKKWAAIALLCCELISWIGIFGAIAAIITLINPSDEAKQS